MSEKILPGMIVVSRKKHTFVPMGTELIVSSIKICNKRIGNDIIGSVYTCRLKNDDRKLGTSSDNSNIVIKIKLYDFIIEPSGQHGAYIYTLMDQGWKIVNK